MVCTFFGHRDAPDSILPKLRSAIIDLIEKEDVTLFYVGHNGSFDRLVARVLSQLSDTYKFQYYIVLAAFPKTNSVQGHTILPEGMESVYPKFAINYRNNWMITRADYVVTYVVNTIGSGAAKMKAIAYQRNKSVIEIHEVCGESTEYTRI